MPCYRYETKGEEATIVRWEMPTSLRIMKPGLNRVLTNVVIALACTNFSLLVRFYFILMKITNVLWALLMLQNGQNFMNLVSESRKFVRFSQ